MDADLRSLARRLADTERRLQGLERAARLERSTVAVQVSADPEVDPVALDVSGALWTGVEAGVDATAAITKATAVQNGDIAQGVIDPSKLTTGVTGNLVQDPLMTTPAWQSLPPWAVTSQPGYCDCNFLRMTDTTGMLTSYPLTPVIPVDPDRTIRTWVAFNHDLASDNASITNPVTVRLRLKFWTDRATPSALPDRVAEWDLYSSFTWGVWDSMEMVGTQPRGCSYVQASLEVQGNTAGALDFCRPEVQVIWNRMQSSDYTPGVYGFAFDSHEAQVQNLQVVEELGAQTGSFKALSINGDDLVSTYINPLPLGGVAFDASPSPGGTNTASTSGTTELKTHEFAFGPVRPARLYRVTVNGHLQGTADNAFDVRVRYTQNGTAPGTASTVLNGATTRVNVGPGSTAFYSQGLFTGGAGFDVMRMGLSIQRALGTGSGFLYHSVADRRLQWTVEDLGIYSTAAAAGTLSQKSYADGSPAQPDPVTRTPYTFPATWTRSFRGDLGPVTGDPDDLWQGYWGTVETDTRSLIGFDYAAIQAALAAGAVTKVRLTVRIKAMTSTIAFDVYLRTHTYTSKPAVWDAASVTGTIVQPFSGSTTPTKVGTTYTFDLPLWVGQAFKAGTARGLAIGPYQDKQDVGAGKLYGMTTLVPSLYFEVTR